jgi:G3E family GTPase
MLEPFRFNGSRLTVAIGVGIRGLTRAEYDRLTLPISSGCICCLVEKRRGQSTCRTKKT